MKLLNLPEYKFKVKKRNENDFFIFDEMRKKYVSLTPEEWVRQNFITYLVREKNYPASLIAVEYEFKYNKLSRRCDAVVFSKKGNPVMILEFKSPEVKITQKVFDQVIQYNINFKIDFIGISNGLTHFFFGMDKTDSQYKNLKYFPSWDEISKN